MSTFYYSVPHLNILSEGREVNAKTKRDRTGRREGRRESRVIWKWKKEPGKGQPHGYQSRPSVVEIDPYEHIQTPNQPAFL